MTTWSTTRGYNFNLNRITNIQYSSPRRYIDTLPIGILISTDRCPRYTGLTGIIKLIKKLLAFRNIGYFNIKIGLLVYAMSRVLKYRGVIEANMYLIIARINIPQNHGGSLIYRRCSIFITIVIDSSS